jgi:hypothetical protein
LALQKPIILTRIRAWFFRARLPNFLVFFVGFVAAFAELRDSMCFVE